MKPTIDERLASVVRSLCDIILPALKEDASLAREQAQLAIGHLTILRQQLDGAEDFERSELSDARKLAANLLSLELPGDAADILRRELDFPAEQEHTRETEGRLNSAISSVMKAVYAAGDDALSGAVDDIVLRQIESQLPRERNWSAPMGFDGELQGSAG